MIWQGTSVKSTKINSLDWSIKDQTLVLFVEGYMLQKSLRISWTSPFALD